jgi:hypothetical protein
MNTPEIVTLIAAILGAAVGAFLGFVWQTKNDKKKDKKTILATIMAYRGVGAAEHDWVKALNMVDVIFYDNKKVRTLLHDYFKHLYRPLFDTGQHGKILLDLIHEMVKDIGYKDLTQTDIMDFYFPEALGQLYPKPAEVVSPSKSSDEQ